jgi:ferredoxin
MGTDPKPVIDKDLCTGCEICVDICPTGALEMDEDEMVAVLAYPDDCDSCGDCEESCPAEAITLE